MVLSIYRACCSNGVKEAERCNSLCMLFSHLSWQHCCVVLRRQLCILSAGPHLGSSGLADLHSVPSDVRQPGAPGRDHCPAGTHCKKPKSPAASFLQADKLFTQQTAIPFWSCCRTNSFSFWMVWQICTTAPKACQQQSTRRFQMLRLRSMVSAHCILPTPSFSFFPNIR